MPIAIRNLLVNLTYMISSYKEKLNGTRIHWVLTKVMITQIHFTLLFQVLF